MNEKNTRRHARRATDLMLREGFLPAGRQNFLYVFKVATIVAVLVLAGFVSGFHAAVNLADQAAQTAYEQKARAPIVYSEDHKHKGNDVPE